jgi:UDPglucose 6-dehydrogenase
MKAPRITVFGTGDLGTVHAACLAQAGFQVLGVDSDEMRVAELSAGQPGILEPGLEVTLCRGLMSGRLSFTSSYLAAAVFGDVHFLCVRAPQWLEACVKTLAPLLSSDDLVVGKPEVPAGTAARLAELCGPAELAWNPGFLRKGHAVPDTVAPGRIVAGVTSSWAERLLRDVYSVQIAAGIPFVRTDLATAELTSRPSSA